MKFFVTLLAIGLGTVRQVHACGGMFCSQSSPTPVEQNAERILFDIRPDGMVTAIVEIQYSGNPQNFSWVVPVPSTPELDVVPPQALRILDAATRPQIIFPPTTCNGQLGGAFQGNDDGGGFGCALAASDSVPARAPMEDGGTRFEDGVEVEDLPQVGPYDPVVVSSSDPRALIDWLNTNRYVVTAEMEPFVAAYVAAGNNFLAMRLTASARVSDITPIKMTCVAGAPWVPLVLTAVGAEPEMGILVFIIGETNFESSNWSNIEIDPALVQPRWNGGSNYWPLVSMLVDDAGGQAFVREMALAADEVSRRTDALGFNDGWSSQMYFDTQLLRLGRRVTRLFTRVSPWEIQDDPIFQPAADNRDKLPLLDLSGHPPFETCRQPVDPPCGNTYCGRGARCAVAVDGPDSCICDTGQVARLIRSTAQPTVHCAEAWFDVMDSVEANLGDPCAFTDCGEGACEVVNGVATCRCLDGYTAAQNGDGVSCVTIDRVDRGGGGLVAPLAAAVPAAEDDAARSACAARLRGRFDGGLLLLLVVLFSQRALRRRHRAPA